MQHAVDAQVSFSGQLVQTILFHHRNPLGPDCKPGGRRNGYRPDRWRGSADRERWIPDLSGSRLRSGSRFITRYRFHEGARTLAPDVLSGYIDAQNALGELRTWTVVLAGKTNAKQSRRIYGADRADRASKLRSSDETTARLGVIASASDLVLDLPLRHHHRGLERDEFFAEGTGPRPASLPIDRYSKPTASGPVAARGDR